jgi:hypothetical protein
MPPLLVILEIGKSDRRHAQIPVLGQGIPIEQDAAGLGPGRLLSGIDPQQSDIDGREIGPAL